MSGLSWSDLTPLLPEIFMALSAMVLLIVGVFRGNGGTAMLCWATIAVFGLAGIFMLGLDWDRHTALNDMFVMDRFGGYMKMLILVGLAASLALSVRYIYEEHMARFEYPILVLFAGLGMMLMVSSNSLLSMYVGLELQSLSLYVLAAIRRDHVRSAEAGIKYFILGALSSGMLLFGISLIYGFTGTVGFHTIAATLDGLGVASVAVTIGLVFVLVGLAFKVSAVPFHMWTPDVYEGAPTSVTALFAIVPKIAAMALLMRLLYEPFGAIIWQWQQIIWFLAVASMMVGAFAALVQNNIKRLMAYSSISNMGYALIGLAIGSSDAAGAVVVYMTIYMIMTIGVFGVIMLMRRNGGSVELISDLSGLSQNSPMLAYAMAILMFSMSGIPPMAGFFGKLMIFEAAVAEGFYWLAVVGVLSSVVAAYYYMRIIKVMFFDEASDPFDKEMVFTKRAIVLMSVLFVLFFIFSPQMLIDTGMNAAAVLFMG